MLQSSWPLYSLAPQYSTVLGVGFFCRCGRVCRQGPVTASGTDRRTRTKMGDTLPSCHGERESAWLRQRLRERGTLKANTQTISGQPRRSAGGRSVEGSIAPPQNRIMAVFGLPRQRPSLSSLFRPFPTTTRSQRPKGVELGRQAHNLGKKRNLEGKTALVEQRGAGPPPSSTRVSRQK